MAINIIEDDGTRFCPILATESGTCNDCYQYLKDEKSGERMTVAELIEELKKHPKDANIVINGCSDDGSEDIHDIDVFLYSDGTVHMC